MLTLIIIIGGVFVYKTDQEMEIKLQQKQLIQPTLFYSRAPSWKRGELLPLEDIKKDWNKNLRRREPGQRLFPGDYLLAEGLSCREMVKEIEVPTEEVTEDGSVDSVNLDETDLCLRVFWDKSDHPQFHEPRLETVWVDGSFHIKGIYLGEELNPASEFTLPPQVVAQYLGEEPILREQHPLRDFPVDCLNSIIAIEDAKFLEHRGVSPLGILRAIAVNLIKGRRAQGGSTLTQQLIKNYFLTPEKTIKRKLLEFMMALLIEHRFDKDLILETYLNVIYMGQQGPYQVRGYGAASKYYFQKNLSDLTLGQCSLLSAIVNSPGQYNPFTHPDKAQQRRDLVLEKMVEQKFINESEKKQASSEAMPKNENVDLYTTLPYFLQAVVSQTRDLGIEDLAGYKVFTTMDLQMQEAAQSAIVNNLNNLESTHPGVKKVKAKKNINLESALVSLDVATGSIRAVVGGRSFKKTQFNRILTSKRQVGSTFKPMVYLTALTSDNEEINPIYELKDQPFTHKYGRQKWTPENYDHSHFGKVPMYFGLKESLNLATAQLALNLGLDSVIETARALGIKSELQPVPSLSLGAFELNPLELLQAYSTVARFGNAIDNTFIEYLEDPGGKVAWASQQREIKSKISAAATQVLIGMLKQTVQTGTAQKILTSGFDKIAAGKTGTTNDYKDSWFVGFTPDLLTIVWTGYDDNTSSGLTGASGSLPTWISFMKEATRYQPVRDFPWTDEVESRTIPISDLKTKGFWMDKAVQEPDEIELIFKK